MIQEDADAKREQLERAIAAQESLRGTLGDDIVDATIAALRQQLSVLEGAAEAEQQRKQMTILFMDVAGSTRLLQGLDPEENLAIMDAVLQRLATPVERRGGRVLRFMGDGFKAVFGLDRARENDPEMAVRAGLELLEEARTIATELEARHRLTGFQLRVGINTGLAVAGGVTEGEGTLMGLTVNLAARLESSAPPGGLLISQHSYQHVRGLFDIEAGEKIEVKGFPDPVQTYRVLRAKPRAFESTTRGVEGVDTPMIGREQELEALQDAFHAVHQDRQTRFITVVAEAGLGKSRLQAEFERWLLPEQAATDLFKGRATLETQDLPYRLLRELIGYRLGLHEGDTLPEVRNKIAQGFAQALGDDPYVERNAHFVGHLLGFDHGDSRHLKGVTDDPRQIRDRAQLYLSAYLAALARQRALVLFIEDAHWADGSSLELLLKLFADLAGQRLLVVTLTRPALFERFAAWDEAAHDQRLELQPLSRQQSQRLVGEVLHKVSDLPEALRDLITQSAEGNPFYLEELIKVLVEDGVIVKGEPHWRIHPERLGAVRIPPTLTGILQARIEGLPQPERRLLQQASVVGRVFWDDAVCFLNQSESRDRTTAPSAKEETRQRLAALRAREMIFEQASSSFSDAVEYLFKHAILREVTYESVLKRVRRVYHALVADWLIDRGSDGAGQIDGLIAGHLEKAGRDEDALEYLTRAAEAAMAKYALTEAAEFYARALSRTPDHELDLRYRLLRGSMKVFAHQGNRKAQRESLDAISVVADALADDRKRAETALGWAWFSFATSDFPAARSAAERAIGLAPTAALDRLALEAHDALAWTALQVGELEDALAHAEMALEVARKIDTIRAIAIGLGTLGFIQSALGNYSAARDHLEQALASYRELGDPKNEGAALANLGVVLSQLGDFQRAQEMYRQKLEIDHDLGFATGEATALVNLGWADAATGDWDSARHHSVAGIEQMKRLGDSDGVAAGLTSLGHAWLGQKQPLKATAAYQESLELRRTLDQAHLAMVPLAGLARAAAAQGDMKAALERVDEILDYLARGGTLDGTGEPLRIYLSCAEILDELGDPRSGEVLAETYDLLQERAGRIPDEGDRRRYLEQIPWHREIVAAWQRSQDPT